MCAGRGCIPPWKDKEWVRKLHEADQNARDSGAVRGACRPASRDDDSVTIWEPLHGPDFPIEIPDFGLISTQFSLRAIASIRNDPPWSGLGFHLLWSMQHSGVGIPDVLAAMVHYGDSRPQAWRRQLKAHLRENYVWSKKCSRNCPLHGSKTAHQHIRRKCSLWNLTLEKFSRRVLRKVESANFSDLVAIVIPDEMRKKLQESHRRYYFFDSRPIVKNARKTLNTKGDVYHCYLLVLIFGRSKRLGLTASQYRMMLGLTRELTRVGKVYAGAEKIGTPKFRKAPTDRKDKAEVIRHGKVHPPSGSHKIPCPLIDQHREYVVFGGNLTGHKGCGYRVISSKSRCWLSCGGYDAKDYAVNDWTCVRKLLEDFSVLSEMFDLTVAAYHTKTRTWKGLAELQACLKTGNGREWIEECTLRVFAPADYLLRWRYELAKRLGFGWIPGGESCPFEANAGTDATLITNGDQLRSYITKQKMTQIEMAKKLKVSRGTVSRHLSGKRDSPGFWKSVDKLVRGQDRAKTK